MFICWSEEPVMVFKNCFSSSDNQTIANETDRGGEIKGSKNPERGNSTIKLEMLIRVPKILWLLYIL